MLLKYLTKIQEEEDMLNEKPKEAKLKKLLKVLQKGEVSELRTKSYGKKLKT